MKRNVLYRLIHQKYSPQRTPLQRLFRRLLTGVAMVWVMLIPVQAEVTEAVLVDSIVSLKLYRGGNVVANSTGFVVQADRFNGYIVTSAESVTAVDSLSVTVPGRGGQLVAEVVRSDLSSDYALLKVNGLNLPTLSFSKREPVPGEVVFTAAKLDGGEKVSLSKGLLRRGYKLTGEDTGWYQHTAALASMGGAVLLNECGQVVGLNFATGATADGSMRALDLSTLRGLLSEQNVKYVTADGNCVSEVVKARQQAEAASEDAKRAQAEAEKAQVVARSLELQLSDSKRSNENLIRQTQLARQGAEQAIRAAGQAQAKADNLRRELEEKTQMLREETQVLLKAFEEDRVVAEERFQDLMTSQQESANNRERILLGFSGLLIVLIGVVLFLARYRASGANQAARRVVVAGQEIGTHLPREELSEYVLDGRDDDGIRYLLRISGDQLADNQDGVIIGRNPKDSPYIINHADVSRKHARIKVKNHRIFIEDLGSTNGTSVNGQSIDDKGPVSVSNGDQIIIGSVVMKLRVMEG